MVVGELMGEEQKKKVPGQAEVLKLSPMLLDSAEPVVHYRLCSSFMQSET